MTTILKTLIYARIGINRGQGDDLQRKTGIRLLNQAMDLLEKGYPLDADIENPVKVNVEVNANSITATVLLNSSGNPEGKEEADMGPKATTPAGKNSGSAKPSNGKQKPRPTAKPANKSK